MNGFPFAEGWIQRGQTLVTGGGMLFSICKVVNREQKKKKAPK